MQGNVGGSELRDRWSLLTGVQVLAGNCAHDSGLQASLLSYCLPPAPPHTSSLMGPLVMCEIGFKNEQMVSQ